MFNIFVYITTINTVLFTKYHKEMVKPLFVSKIKGWNINNIIISEIHIFCQLDKHLLCKLQETLISNVKKETLILHTLKFLIKKMCS